VTTSSHESGQIAASVLAGTEAQNTTTEAETLVRRAPMGFLWNQLYQLWLFGSGFLLTQIVARGVSTKDYGVYSIALTAFNTATYLAAFGLEEAAIVWVPRALTEEGRQQASSVIRRLLFARILCVLIVCASFLFFLPVLPGWLEQLGLPFADRVAETLGDPALLDHLVPLTFYIAGTGVLTLLVAIFTSLLHTRVTLTVSGLAQAGNLVLALVFLWLGWGVDGVLWALGLIAWLTALVYLIWLSPMLWVHRPGAAMSLRAAWRLSVAAWLTNLANGALLKQVIISLLTFYAFSYTQVGFFNLAFQLGHSAGLLLVAGLTGVGMATMAAAYSGENRLWLSISWRAVLKVQTLLALPLLLFSLLNADTIVTLLFGRNYAAVGPLLQVFLGFTIVTRVAGGGAHQAALFVLGKQKIVVYLQWAALILTAILGFALIPLWGPAGALIAAGLPPVLVEFAQLAVLWRLLPWRYPLRFIGRCALAMSVPVAASLLLRVPVIENALLQVPVIGHMLVQPATSLEKLLGLIVLGLLFTVLLIGSLLVVRPLQVDDVVLIEKLNGGMRRVLLLLTRKSVRAASALAAAEASAE
jgi:O-antigen/teichoic acid export membrane protein